MITKIEELLKPDTSELTEYLYLMLIEQFGMLRFLQDLNQHIANQREEGYQNGKKSMRNELKDLLGI